MMLDDSSMSQFCSVTFNKHFNYQDVSKYLVFLKKKKNTNSFIISKIIENNDINV